MIVIIVSRFAEHDMVHSNPAAWPEESRLGDLPASSTLSGNTRFTGPLLLLGWIRLGRLLSFSTLGLGLAGFTSTWRSQEDHRADPKFTKLSQFSMIGRHILWKSKLGTSCSIEVPTRGSSFSTVTSITCWSNYPQSPPWLNRDVQNTICRCNAKNIGQPEALKMRTRMKMMKMMSCKKWQDMARVGKRWQ